MTRALPALFAALAAAAALAPAPAAADPHAIRQAHRHPGHLFRIRHQPELNRHYVYRVFNPRPGDPAGLLVERSEGWLGDEGFADLSPAACPPLGRQVAAVARLPMPAPAIAPPRSDRYASAATPRNEHYQFDGFVRFANGGEGEISFMSYDVEGRPTDPQLEWMRELVRAFDACAPRRPRRP